MRYRARPKPPIAIILLAMLGFLCLPAVFAAAQTVMAP